jgi:hypothetical protein
MIKLWKSLRGFKRQAGAIIMFLMIILPAFGVVIPEEITKNITVFGTLLFGVGWLDKGAVLIKENLDQKKE